MNQVQSHNNNGLFRNNKRKQIQNRRLFIRRSKIFHSKTNNHSTSPQILQLKHRKIKKKLFQGAGDQLINEKKHIDFTELEQIFDNAIKNHLPTKESPIQQETRIDLSHDQPIEPIKYSFLNYLKSHKILSATTLILFSMALGFFSVFLFLK